MIASISVRDLFPRVLAYAPNVPDPAVRAAVLHGAREFCRETWLWREWLGPIEPMPDVEQYQTPLPLDSEFVAVLASDLPGLAMEVQGGGGGVFLAIKVADAAEPFSLHCALMPSNDAEYIPAIIAMRWDDILVYSATAFLLDIPNASWTNHALAQRNRELFKAKVGHVKRDVALGHIATPLRVRARRFI